ncbi:alginate lyase family protein [Autumnicola psychrophila]|uniref:Alginate lyase family protein n=1 Tax=Autumnicola psychrophila TaxID=3075592 RepID=A0ABU3DLY9_9FLAO|nr:alginate lyase family protein [Zunongwangia sp. F225]MDT0684744.1 alginate lyase family protein [Zunongwangia sp. F225]
MIRFFNFLMIFCFICTSACTADDNIKLIRDIPPVGQEEQTDPDPEPEPDPDEQSNFEHPGLLHTEEDFARVKEKVEAGAEPWISGWNKLTANSHSQLSYTPNPTERLIRGGNSREVPEADNYNRAMNDAAAAYQLGLRWKVSGDDAYADKAVEILNAWAATCEEVVGDSNRALGAGIYGYQFANAAEIVRDYEGWEDEDFKTYQTWMKEVFYSVNKAFLDTHWDTCISHYWANWDLVNLASVLAIGVLTDDQELFDFAIDYLKTGAGNGNLNKAVYYVHEEEDLGQLQESGRDQGHSLLCVGYMGEISQMAYNQGVDLFGYQDNRILKGAEYTAKYNVLQQDVPFEPYNNCDDVNHTEISSEGRGGERPIWSVIYYHYAKVKGVDVDYIKEAIDFYGTEGGGGDYGPNSGGFDSLGFGTLMYTLE